MRQLIIFLSLGLCFTFSSCGEDPLPIDTCLQEKIDAFRADATVCPTLAATIGGNVVTYNFKGQTVYCFNWGPCLPNKTIEIWTEDCVLLCEMGGPGQVDFCDGTPWLGNASEIDNLYQN